MFKDEIEEFFNNEIKIFDSSIGVTNNLLNKLDDKFKIINKNDNNSNKENLNSIELYITKEDFKYKELFYKLLNK